MKRLLIRPGAIGDCIMSFPALQHLRTDYTEVWVPSAVVPLVQFANKVRPISSTGLDMLGIADTGVLEALKQFDSIVSWYGTNRPEFRDQLPQAEFHAALPRADYVGRATDFFASQVGAPMDLIPGISVPHSRRDTIAIHPFSGGSRKNWPLDRFQELARLLPLPVEWSAGPEELLAGATRFDDLYELAQWLAGARLYIGNDSGITHLAAAVGVPVLALFGPTDPKVWAPRGANVLVMRSEPIHALQPSDCLPAIHRLLGYG